MTDPAEHIALLIQQGNKIEAIKVMRELTGIGLKEAKDIVDQMDGTPKQKGCFGSLVVICAVGVLGLLLAM